MEDKELYDKYIIELLDEIEDLRMKISLVKQVLIEIRDRDNTHFSKIAEAVLSEINGKS